MRREYWILEQRGNKTRWEPRFSPYRTEREATAAHAKAIKSDAYWRSRKREYRIVLALSV